MPNPFLIQNDDTNYTKKLEVSMINTSSEMVAGAGFEPTTFGLWARRATRLLHPALFCFHTEKTPSTNLLSSINLKNQVNINILTVDIRKWNLKTNHLGIPAMVQQVKNPL